MKSEKIAGNRFIIRKRIMTAIPKPKVFMPRCSCQTIENYKSYIRPTTSISSKYKNGLKGTTQSNSMVRIRKLKKKLQISQTKKIGKSKKRKIKRRRRSMEPLNTDQIYSQKFIVVT